MENNTPQFPYILFDLGNTLIYFDGTWSEVLQSASRRMTAKLNTFGYQLDEQTFPAVYQELVELHYQKREDELIEYTSEFVLREALMRQEVTARHHYTPLEVEQVRMAIQEMYAVSQAHWHVEADTHATLQALRDLGCRLGIVSNAADDADVQTLVDTAQIRPYFDFIVTSAAFGYRKPSERIFRHALKYWGALPEQALMVGDTLNADIEGANRLNMKNVWIRRRVDTPANRQLAQETFPPTWTVDTLPEIVDIVKGQAGSPA